MNVSFGPNATPVTAPETQEQQALVPVEAPGVPVTARPTLGDRLPSFDEVVFPRINLSQNIGMLKDSFPPGSVVLGKQVALFVPPEIDVTTGTVKRTATAPATITVLGFYPNRYCEKVEGGAGGGLIVNTEAEVRQYGGTLDWKEWNLKKASGMKRFETLADALVLVERPETSKDDDTVFVFEADGKKYAIARWGMRGGSYTEAAKNVFFTQRVTGCLRGGYPTHSFSVSSRLKKSPNGNTAWVPVCVAREKSTPAFLALASQILTGILTPAPAPANAE